MSVIATRLQRLVKGDDGQDLIEYALLASLVALAAVGGMTVLRQTIDEVLWQGIAQKLNDGN
jgi:Flp pilus assembly pilin Flp